VAFRRLRKSEVDDAFQKSTSVLMLILNGNARRATLGWQSRQILKAENGVQSAGMRAYRTALERKMQFRSIPN
jgi:hypothetical protein